MGSGLARAYRRLAARSVAGARCRSRENSRADAKVSDIDLPDGIDPGFPPWRTGVAGRRQDGKVSGRVELLRVVQPARLSCRGGSDGIFGAGSADWGADCWASVGGRAGPGGCRGDGKRMARSSFVEIGRVVVHFLV